MLKIKYHNQFKKDYKLALKRGLKSSKLEKVLEILIKGEWLPEKYRDHQLIDNKHYRNVRECHIQPDWLLIYQIDNDRLILNLVRTGSHSDLF